VPKEGLEALRARVAADPKLARQLRRVAPERFAAEVVLIARELGYDLAETDVNDAASRGRTAWTMRWIA
jgi:hypothetical protein